MDFNLSSNFQLFFYLTGVLLAVLYAIRDYIHFYYLVNDIFLTSFPNLDYTSSLYLLSTLAQCQAAIFAVAIGISSIVLQMTSSRYSSRLSYIFTNNSTFMCLFFGASILFDFILIISLPKQLDIFYFWLVMISIVLAIFLFAHLFINIFNTISLLNPSKVLAQIEKHNSKDKREQIFDMIRGSVENHDIVSFKNCLDALCNCPVDLPHSNDQQLIEISDEGSVLDCLDLINSSPLLLEAEFTISELIRAGKISTKLENNEITLYVFKKIYEIFTELSPNNYIDYIDKITEFLIYCSKKELEISTTSSMCLLAKTVMSCSHDEVLVRTNLLNSIINIGLVASENKHETLAKESAEIIKQLINIFIESKYTINRRHLLKISFIGLYSAENKLETPTEKILVILGNLLLYFKISCPIQGNDLNLVSYTLESMLKIKSVCVENNFTDCVEIIDQAISKLEWQYYIY
jgi:hypothetical protein